MTKTKGCETNRDKEEVENGEEAEEKGRRREGGK